MLERIISMIMSVVLLIPNAVIGVLTPPSDLRVVVPENWELLIGDSRTLECVFDESVTQRTLEWSVEPADVASVDKWGRVTALKEGEAVITARGNGFEDSVTLNVVSTPTLITERKRTVMYGGEAYSQVDNLQKFVSRYAKGDPNIPEYVSEITDYSSYRKAVTADGAVWEITDYGVLRTDKTAPTQRDVYQRFMGDRYFYSNDSSAVRGIVADGSNGIWAVMDNGVTHIEMREMDGTDKAVMMSATTQAVVDRHGMTDAGYFIGGNWLSKESDNDGLWTSMYGAGELMRYATVRNAPDASYEEINAAKQAAYRSAEAVLMLYYITMRSGITQAYVRHQMNINVPGNTQDRWLSSQALEVGGDRSFMLPSESPAKAFEKGMLPLALGVSADKLKTADYYYPLSPESWSDPLINPDKQYEKQTRLLEGFPARTYSLDSENSIPSGNIHWDINSDGTATGVSTKPFGESGYLLSGENLRGLSIDASSPVPERLWSDLLGEDISHDEITYKTDTSADELIGHMFIFKLIYDIIAPEDPEIKAILVEAIDSLAQHLSDNSYMLCDGSGQPTTWGNFSRAAMSAGAAVGLAPLHSLVLLSIFKTAAYITGYEKWENEYRMAALDPAYDYASLTAQYYERMMAAMEITIANDTAPIVGAIIAMLQNTTPIRTVYKLIVNYSDEEMAMLGFYTMFAMEQDEKLLRLYRDAIDDWWISVSSSGNPLWYYIYQLAYPDKKIKDCYGNNIVEYAAWSLSRHPTDNMMYCASNPNRDDIAALDLSPIGLNLNSTMTYNVKRSGALPQVPENAGIFDMVKFVLKAVYLDWDVAAPDERTLYKYNTSSFNLTTWHLPYCTQASTTYTLPYWLGVYHGMLEY